MCSSAVRVIIPTIAQPIAPVVNVCSASECATNPYALRAVSAKPAAIDA